MPPGGALGSDGGAKSGWEVSALVSLLVLVLVWASALPSLLPPPAATAGVGAEVAGVAVAPRAAPAGGKTADSLERPRPSPGLGVRAPPVLPPRPPRVEGPDLMAGGCSFCGLLHMPRQATRSSSGSSGSGGYTQR